MPKVLIISGNPQYRNMFEGRGWETHSGIAGSTFDLISGADLIQFTGGEDVTPALYGEENTSSYNSEVRDFYEAGIFAIARRMGKPMAGICRGGQFLNVMCGGKMIQDVKGHAVSNGHTMFDIEDDREIVVTSTHHQAMIPGHQHLLICKADDDICEVILYREKGVLCFQPHPEFHKGECQDYYFELLKLIFNLG
jgi:gamma-glutamyl-gamma-aminobutyrate hydrolase PuuD